VQTNYITQTGYWPNALQYFVRGNTLRYSVGYNTRLQPTETYEAVNNTNSVSTMLQYSCLNWGTSRNFGSSLYGLCPVVNNTNDNGTLQGVTYDNGGPGYSNYLAFTQSFTYDKVNRLATSSDSGGWSRSFGYDSYGNMWVSGSSGIPLAGNTPTSNVYTASNRISGSNYDASGNQFAVNGDTATYDAENRLTTVTESPAMGGGTETLVYDGSGQRVQKILPSGTTNYVYDAFGRLAAEYSTNPTESPCTTCYLSYDHLGSVRMVTDASAKLIARHDFLPFGEELPPNSAGRNGQWGPGDDNIAQKFTGQIRDEETDLDYFNARYFGAALGRFISPDPENTGADPTDPQSWNGYAYVLGNPLNGKDVRGLSRIDYDGLNLIRASSAAAFRDVYDPAGLEEGHPALRADTVEATEAAALPRGTLRHGLKLLTRTSLMLASLPTAEIPAHLAVEILRTSKRNAYLFTACRGHSGAGA
jgi:RHS repeat-associated protein